MGVSVGATAVAEGATAVAVEGTLVAEARSSPRGAGVLVGASVAGTYVGSVCVKPGARVAVAVSVGDAVGVGDGVSLATGGGSVGVGVDAASATAATVAVGGNSTIATGTTVAKFALRSRSGRWSSAASAERGLRAGSSGSSGQGR